MQPSNGVDVSQELLANVEFQQKMHAMQRGLDNMDPSLLASQGYIVMPMEGGRIGEPQYVPRGQVANESSLAAVPVLLPEYHAELGSTGTHRTHVPHTTVLGDEKQMEVPQPEISPEKEKENYHGAASADEKEVPLVHDQPDLSYLSWMHPGYEAAKANGDHTYSIPVVTATAGTGGTDADEVEGSVSEKQNCSQNWPYSENDYQQDYPQYQDWHLWSSQWDDWGYFGSEWDDNTGYDWGYYDFAGDSKWMDDSENYGDEKSSNGYWILDNNQCGDYNPSGVWIEVPLPNVHNCEEQEVKQPQGLLVPPRSHKPPLKPCPPSTPPPLHLLKQRDADMVTADIPPPRKDIDDAPTDIKEGHADDKPKSKKRLRES